VYEAIDDRSDDDVVGIQVTETSGFLCTICGAENVFTDAVRHLEEASCTSCGSTARWRGVIHALTVGLYGVSMPIAAMPTEPERVVIGLSCWPGYADRLAAKMQYINTYFHRAPMLDVCRPPSALERSADVVVSSEVFEHVVPPVHRAFTGAYALLRPGGLLVLTVPRNRHGETEEHFPDLHEHTLSEEDGAWVLRNVTTTGEVQEFRDLVFHGGPGSTLEMRKFSTESVVRHLEEAGFVDIRLLEEPVPEFGLNLGPRSCPVIARRPGTDAIGAWLLGEGKALRTVTRPDGRAHRIEGPVELRGTPTGLLQDHWVTASFATEVVALATIRVVRLRLQFPAGIHGGGAAMVAINGHHFHAVDRGTRTVEEHEFVLSEPELPGAVIRVEVTPLTHLEPDPARSKEKRRLGVLVASLEFATR